MVPQLVRELFCSSCHHGRRDLWNNCYVYTHTYTQTHTHYNNVQFFIWHSDLDKCPRYLRYLSSPVPKLTFVNTALMKQRKIRASYNPTSVRQLVGQPVEFEDLSTTITRYTWLLQGFRPSTESRSLTIQHKVMSNITAMWYAANYVNRV
jgi:hypothetical protein